jgi:hypothetical protein
VDFEKDTFYVAMAPDSLQAYCCKEEGRESAVMVFSSAEMIPQIMEKYGILAYRVGVINDCPKFVNEMHDKCKDIVINPEAEHDGTVSGVFIPWHNHKLD